MIIFIYKKLTNLSKIHTFIDNLTDWIILILLIDLKKLGEIILILFYKLFYNNMEGISIENC